MQATKAKMPNTSMNEIPATITSIAIWRSAKPIIFFFSSSLDAREGSKEELEEVIPQIYIGLVMRDRRRRKRPERNTRPPTEDHSGAHHEASHGDI